MGNLVRRLANRPWLRIGLCILYAAALTLQLEQPKHDHHHNASGTVIAGTAVAGAVIAGTVIAGMADKSPCNFDHDGATRHCHTVSIVSLCAPAGVEFATLDYPYSLPLPPRIAAFSDVGSKPQFRPPRFV